MNTLLPSFQTRLWLGILISAILPYLILLPLIRHYNGHAYAISTLGIAFAHFISAQTIYKMAHYPGPKYVFSIFPTSLFWFACVVLALRLLKLPYSLWYTGIGFLISVVIYYMGFLSLAQHKLLLAYLPQKRTAQISALPQANWLAIEAPEIPKENIQGYVADLRDSTLSAQWQKFLASETLRGIPVYHIQQIEEILTGRIKITHMYENDLGALLPSKSYMRLKFVLEVALILLSLPVVLPIMLITAICIKLESKGPIFFTQNRVGMGGKEFKIYKFRSMAQDSEAKGAQFASAGDMRVTKIGRFIRKVRIDELPQFFNILKGEMSLIGPRPEQKVFVEQFEQEIPFYNYRHIVKPGISGWAQVMHGYAANTEETQIKIEHDFFYIKHYSLSLDTLIFFKTIKTMLTGFGAR